MSLKTLETKWKVALTAILEELTESQFRKLLFNLDKIPQGVKTDKVREEIPQIIIQYFGPEGSILVIEKEMKQIPRMDAAVQGLLRPFVEKLKKQRQKNKETTCKAAAESGPVTKRQKPAAAAAESGPTAKKKKPGADQQKSCQPDKTDPPGPVKPKQKKSEKQDVTQKPTKLSKTDPPGPVKPKQKKSEKQDVTQKPTKISKTDPPGPVKPKQKKSEKQDVAQKPAGSTKLSKVQSAAVQPGKMKKQSSKKNTDLDAPGIWFQTGQLF